MPKTKAKKNNPLYKVTEEGCVRRDSYAAFCVIKRVRAHLFLPLFGQLFYEKTLYLLRFIV